MFMRRLLVLVLWGLSASLFGAEGPQLYRGTLGTMAIVVELNLRDPARVSGRYFYQKYRHDLALEGRLQDGQLSLLEGRDGYAGARRPELHLQRSARGWQGEWLGPQGRRLPVTLSQPAIEAPPAGAEPFWYRLHEASPYEFLRLRASPPQPGRRERFMGYTLQWWNEPVSGLASFELLDGYPQAQLDLINQRLRERFREDVISYHACRLGAGDGRGEFVQRLRPTLLSAQIVSLNIFTRYDCGGAHPDFSASPLTLEARSGEVLALEDVLWVGAGPAFLYREDGDGRPEPGSVSFATFSGYRSRHLTPWLVQQLARLYPGQMSEPAEGGCRYADDDVWGFPAWYFSPAGLHVSPYFARAMRPCDLVDWPVLPYALVRQHPGRLHLALPK